LKTKIPSQPLHFFPEPLDNTRLAHLCGPMDENLRQISAALDVTIFRRGEKFIVNGANAQQAVELLTGFYAIADKTIAVEDVQLAVVEKRAAANKAPPKAQADPASPSAPTDSQTIPAPHASPIHQSRRPPQLAK